MPQRLPLMRLRGSVGHFFLCYPRYKQLNPSNHQNGHLQNLSGLEPADFGDQTQSVHCHVGKVLELTLIDTIHLDIDIPFFDPQVLESYVTLRPRLDSFQKAGITEGQFQGLFSQCSKCHRFMTQRSREYHECPQDPSVLNTLTNCDVLHLRLDCYCRGPGVSQAQFQQMFTQCIYCDLFMT
jgi:hypothetical protein